MHHPKDRITHTTVFVTPVVVHWLERGQMMNDHSDIERRNQQPSLHGLLCSIRRKRYVVCTIPHTTAFVTPVKEHWLEREIFQWIHHCGTFYFIELFLVPVSAPRLVCKKGRGMCYPVCGMMHIKNTCC